ncbi:MAG: SAM-dependent methyltransferase [Halobacteria archaeon]|nr:SAM-dependent methyltransferase [Halobacteria archaeon]
MPKDKYYNKAKQEGYRARSAYKLIQMDDERNLLSPSDTVVDLGAAPGGWLQVEAERAGEVVGVDLQSIDPIDEDGVETVRGDMTEERTLDEIREITGGEVDVVTSDASPNLTGDWNIDHSRSVHLARSALETAEDLLRPGGSFVVKVFQGDMIDDFRSDVESSFDYVSTASPDASRDESSEVYVIGKEYIDAPVEEGEELEVDIISEGDEGDGIAKIDGYTLIVKGGDEGETTEVRVTDLKSGYGFAEKV